MSRKKKSQRHAARVAVAERSGGACEVCRSRGSVLDAHHITPRDLMPNGGTVPSNLIGLCGNCHLAAEDALDPTDEEGAAIELIDDSFSPSRLYARIGSSYEKALADSEAIA